MDRILRESIKFYGEYIDSDGTRRRTCLYTDYDASCRQLKELVKRADREHSGETDRSMRIAGECKMSKHVEDYKAYLNAKGVSAKHLSETVRRLERVIGECGFARLANVEAASVIRLLVRMGDAGRSPRCRNTYRSALLAFMRWALADGRVPRNPIEAVPIANESTDLRVNRRVTTPAEAQRLLDAAVRRPVERAKFFIKYNGRDATDEDRKLIGIEHALMWKFILLTALRKAELTGIRWADVNLEDAYVFVSAQIAKWHKERHVALRADLVEDLRRWRVLLGAVPDTAPVFRVPERLIRVLRCDLKFAGIEYKTDDGEQADVHSLRTTCGTWIERVSSESIAGEHLGHRPSSVTGRHYIKVKLSDTRAALDMLPPLTIAELAGENHERKATGTDGRAIETVQS